MNIEKETKKECVFIRERFNFIGRVSNGESRIFMLGELNHLEDKKNSDISGFFFFFNSKLF